jgi:hypothetical protein
MFDNADLIHRYSRSSTAIVETMTLPCYPLCSAGCIPRRARAFHPQGPVNCRSKDFKMSLQPAGEKLSTILKHDAKVTSYKIALLRAINDVVLAFPGLQPGPAGVAVPLRLLAERWVGYYWPFVDAQRPIRQGPCPVGSLTKSDIAFRPALTRLRSAWEAHSAGLSDPADGYLAVNEMRTHRKRKQLPQLLQEAFEEAVQRIAQTLEMPIRYAGPRGSQWSVFDRPNRASAWGPGIARTPGARDAERCLAIPAGLWQTFASLSLWVEALCVHEWCLFTEGVEQPAGCPVGRGEVFTLLTAPPVERRPLSWERRHIDQLLQQGSEFRCPWTGRPIRQGRA